MSEPMTTHEIEDVLSSIRRLVSDDLRPAPRGAASADVTTEKLLLTPALRVVGTDEVGLDAQAHTDDGSDDWVDATLPGEVGDVVARIGSGVAEDDWESPMGDVDEWPGAGWSQPEVAEHDVAADVPFFHTARADRPVSGVADVPHAADDASGATWADQAEAEVMADLAQDIQDDVASAMAPQSEASLFDEQVLRDLVRDLIREELAGALGERITRNVRKLVRAEIARALAVHELE